MGCGTSHNNKNYKDTKGISNKTAIVHHDRNSNHYSNSNIDNNNDNNNNNDSLNDGIEERSLLLPIESLGVVVDDVNPVREEVNDREITLVKNNNDDNDATSGVNAGYDDANDSSSSINRSDKSIENHHRDDLQSIDPQSVTEENGVSIEVGDAIIDGSADGNNAHEIALNNADVVVDNNPINSVSSIESIDGLLLTQKQSSEELQSQSSIEPIAVPSAVITEAVDSTIAGSTSIVSLSEGETANLPAVEAGMVAGEPAVKTGYLWKLGHVVKSWKRRYIVLESGVIKYYASIDSSSVRNAPINLRDAIATMEYQPKGGVYFILITPSVVSAFVMDQSSSNTGNGTSEIFSETDVVSEHAKAAYREFESAQPSVMMQPSTLVNSAGVVDRNDKSLLLKTDNLFTAQEWTTAIQQHIAYKCLQPIPSPMTGFARKEGQYIKSWKRRYFVLDRGLLSYYAGNRTDAPAPLSGVGSVGQPMSLQGCAVSCPSRLRIRISSSDRSQISRILLLEVGSDDERERWISAIVSHIEFINKEMCS